MSIMIMMSIIETKMIMMMKMMIKTSDDEDNGENE